MTTRLGVKIQEEDVQSRRNSLLNHSNMHSEIIRMIKSGVLYGGATEQIDADARIEIVSSSASRQASLNKVPCSGSSESIHSKTESQSIDTVGPNFLY